MSIFEKRMTQQSTINHIEKCLIDAIETAIEKYPNATRLEFEAAMLRVLTNLNHKQLKEQAK